MNQHSFELLVIPSANGERYTMKLNGREIISGPPGPVHRAAAAMIEALSHAHIYLQKQDDYPKNGKRVLFGSLPTSLSQVCGIG